MDQWSIVYVSYQFVHNMLLVHEVESIGAWDAEWETSLSLKLKYCLVMFDVLVSWISLHNEALSILLSHIINEVSLTHYHFDLLKSLFTSNLFIVVVITKGLHIWVFLSQCPVDAPHERRANKLIRELSPNITLKLQISFLAHCALHYTRYHGVIAGEYLIVKVSVRSEMGNLCLLVEWIYQHQVDSILCHVTCTWSLSSRQECEMRATFDPESLWIEPNILKLVEL